MRRSQLRTFKAKLNKLCSIIREKISSSKQLICFNICKLRFINAVEKELLSWVSDYYLTGESLASEEQKAHVLQRAYLIILENEIKDVDEMLEEIFHEKKLCVQYIHCDEEMKTICKKINGS